ncbi:MAG: RidA family protein [Bacteroidota bacterium]
MLRSSLFRALALGLFLPVFAVAQTPDERVETLGLTLPPAPNPIANYVTAVQDGDVLHLSGHLACPESGWHKRYEGQLGNGRTIEEGYGAARETGLCLLSTLKRVLGSLNRVERVIQVRGYVNAAPGFTDHSKVVNGVSDLLVEVFGESGKHVRAALGMSSLPRGAMVEIEMSVALTDE